MQNKLQEITDKLYNEGLVKGKEEAQGIVNEARREADLILLNAKKDAKEIVEQAERKAQDAQTNALTEIRMAGKQMITLIKSSVENAITAQSITPATRSAFEQVEFVKELIKIALSKFSLDDENQNLTLLLPQDKQKELEFYMKETIGTQFQIGLELRFDDRLHKGFKVQSKDNAYFISFTDADFDALFRDFLRPKIQEILF